MGATESPPLENTALDEAAAGDERLAYRGPVLRLLTRPEIGALIGAAVIWVYFWLVSDVFGTAAGAANYLDVSATLGIMAVAVSLLMIGGEFDLSAGAMTGATGILVILLVIPPGEFGGAGLSLWFAIPLTLAFALGVGWFNGTLVEKTGLPSFIVTLSTFFVLIGAKLGFAKLFTSKVIVEGLNEGSGYDFWVNIFGSKWTRNDHIFDSRDMLFGILMVIGFAAVFFGMLELSYKRRERFNATGLIVAGAGIAGALAGLWGLVSTDTVDSNLLFAAVLALGVIVAAVGIGVWRFERVSDRGSFSLSGTSLRNIAIAIGVLLFGSFVAITLDSSSEDIVGFMLTVQGLRAVVFGFGAIVGVLLPVLVARSEGKRSPITKFVLMTGTSLVIVGLAFLIQSEATSRKFRAEFFAVLLLIALIVFVAGLMPLLFQARTAAHPGADRLGKIMTVLGIGLFLVAVAVRLLYMTSEEAAATRAVFNYRVSILWFIAFAVGASLVLMRTRFGSWTFAVGGNKKAAREVGVPAARTKTILFMTVSVAAFIVGMLLAFRLNSVQANVGDGQEFLFIIAAVVGGNLLTGGYGSAAGGALGALIMAMSFQGIPFAGWNSDWRFLFVGVILLLAVLVNNFVRKKAEEAV
jgi:ribose/xylose/arabinose/galactoside ABC-type transport system permease subunit